MSLAHWDNRSSAPLQTNGEYPETQAAPQGSRQGQSENAVNREKCIELMQLSLMAIKSQCSPAV